MNKQSNWYDRYQSNHKTINDYNGITSNLSDNYDRYFVTYTFQNTHKRLPSAVYKTFFRFHFRKLNKFCKCSNPKRSVMILFPEQSYHKVIGKMIASPHYHGFICVHKKYKDKFAQCVQDISENDLKNRKTFTQKLSDNDGLKRLEFTKPLSQPYPLDKSITQIKLTSSDVQMVHDEENMTNAYGYATKNLLESPYSDDDIFLFKSGAIDFNDANV